MRLPKRRNDMEVIILKTEESDDFAVFRYGLDDANMGEATLDKHEGALMNTVPIEHARAKRIYGAAAYKIMQAFKSGEPLPDRMRYVSY
jgi:hypothetical protein